MGKIVLIGASTGGPGVIEQLITSLPPQYPHPICIVQHFPPELTQSFATRLQTCTQNRVVESSDGLKMDPGLIVIAHGGVHIGFSRDESGNIILHHLTTGERNDFIPSIDVMLLSAAQHLTPSSILAILLTGIGDDGARGMTKITALGGMSVCQDEKSSPVFGMPARAIERGGAKFILAPESITDILKRFGNL